MMVLQNDDADPGAETGEAWELVPGDLNQCGNSARLWIKRMSSMDAGGKFDPSKLEVGDLVDCKDTMGTWLIASVVKKYTDALTLHYKG